MAPQTWAVKLAGNLPPPSSTSTSVGISSGEKDASDTFSPPLVSHHSVPAMDYGQIQQDEIASLQAIYATDFELVDAGGAWKVGLPGHVFYLSVNAHPDFRTHRRNEPMPSISDCVQLLIRAYRSSWQ